MGRIDPPLSKLLRLRLHLAELFAHASRVKRLGLPGAVRAEAVRRTPIGLDDVPTLQDLIAYARGSSRLSEVLRFPNQPESHDDLFSIQVGLIVSGRSSTASFMCTATASLMCSCAACTRNTRWLSSSASDRWTSSFRSWGCSRSGPLRTRFRMTEGFSGVRAMPASVRSLSGRTRELH